MKFKTKINEILGQEPGDEVYVNQVKQFDDNRKQHIKEPINLIPDDDKACKNCKYYTYNKECINESIGFFMPINSEYDVNFNPTPDFYCKFYEAK